MKISSISISFSNKDTYRIVGDLVQVFHTRFDGLSVLVGESTLEQLIKYIAKVKARKE